MKEIKISKEEHEHYLRLRELITWIINNEEKSWHKITRRYIKEEICGIKK